MKKSFTILELLVTLTIMSILYTFFIPKNNINKLNEITNKLIIYLKQTRYKAMIDEKQDSSNELWHKQRWTLKFLRCRSEVGGIYFSIYSDKNLSGHINKEETLKDSLTNKHIYSSNRCNEHNTNSKYVLISKNFDIENVNITCNDTKSLGQISFSSDGNVYTKLSNNANEYEEYKLKNRCKIRLIDKFNNFSEIFIEPKTGYISRNPNII